MNIDLEKTYNAHEVLQENFLYWIKSYPTLTKWIRQDKENWHILNATIIGTGTATRYFIRGENILRFVASFEDGSLHS